MDLERERRFNQLVMEALRLEPDDRSQVLNELAGDDPELVQEVLGSLGDGLGDFLEGPAVFDLEPVDGPIRVGPYVLGERLGIGGMGEVRRAVQRSRFVERSP